MAFALESTVVQKKTFARGNYILSIRAPQIAETCRPGQFVMLSGLSGGSTPFPLLKRALAIYSVESEEGQLSIVRLLIKVVGEGTRRLAELQDGDRCSIIGPLGNGFDLADPRDKTHLLIAGGTGIASVYLLARTLLRKGCDTRLAYGGRTREDLAGLEDFQELGMPVRVTTEDGSLGLRGLVTGAVRETLETRPGRLNFFACGPNAMMQAVSGLARENDIPCQISVEVRMACGFGVCLGCSVKTPSGYRLACSDGPVFDAEDFIWEPDWTIKDAERNQATQSRPGC